MKSLSLPLLLALLLVGGPADALEGGYPGERPDTWDQPPSRVQAAEDSRLVPVGKGALFVPAMSDSGREPAYTILRGEQVIDTVPMGRKAVLEPGVYEIQLGSGTLQDRFSRRVLIKEGRTTVVPATWSSLVVNVVDERSIPFRGSYELIHLETRRNLGLGLGADVELGEEVRSWVLEPGTYMLIKTGESYQARRDFYTFRLQRGELHKLSAVMDRDEGTLLGAGEMTLLEGETEVSDWKLNLVLGGDAEANRRSDYQGFPNGYGFTLGGYLDFVAQFKPEHHLFYTRFKVEEKQVKLPGESFQKDLDELKLDALYVYRVLPWFGPYARLGTQTSLFPSYADIGGARKEVVVMDNGAVARSLGEHADRVRIADPFAPVELKGGAGLSFIVTASYILDANVRFGFGGRALFMRGLLEPRDDGATPAFEMRERANAYQYGFEATLVGSLRLTRWILATTEFEFLEPLDDYDNPIVDWETTVGLRLLSWVSLNYIFELISDVERSRHLQTEHRLLMRFTWRIL